MKLLIVAALAAQTTASGQSAEAGRYETHDHAVPVAEAPSGAAVPLYEGLGAHALVSSTNVALAQQYLDQGIALTFGFNHAEAIRSFEAAFEADSTCAMCQWGIAFALGPNINGPVEREAALAAFTASRRALQLAEAKTISDLEQGLITALAERYAADAPADRTQLDASYADAMEALADRHPEDANVAVLAADALMNLSPWDYWSDGDVLKPATARARVLLERAMDLDPANAGACHMYVHLLEERRAEDAVPCAEKLPDLMPGVGHIVHMPGHVYIRVGRYADAMEANVHAVHADEAVLPDQAPDGAYALAYYPHNFHFLWFAANMAGASERSIEAARQTADNVALDLMRAPGLEALQHYLVTPLYAFVRFGRWEEILQEPAPPADLTYPTGVWHYARALAHVAANDLRAAEADLTRLRELAASPALEQQLIWGLNPTSTLLGIAADVVSGEIAARRGEFESATKHLRAALEAEESLVYDEPPTWHLPVRHNLGAVLLEAGRAAEAERVYREDLEIYRRNGWALAGLRAALLAQGRDAEADEVHDLYREAWSAADIDVETSRIGR